MSNIPVELKFANTHEWVKMEDDGSVTIGITDHAQDLLGDIVFVELPEIDTVISAKDEVSVVESVKAASDIYAPLSGEIIEINSALLESPEMINSSPYEEGWLFKLQPSDEAELDDLMDAEAYGEKCEEE